MTTLRKTAAATFLLLLAHRSRQVHAFSAVAPPTPSPVVPSATASSSSSGSASKPRPLHQNWWPVTLTSALDPDRPNAIELLDRRLVLWKARQSGDSESDGWSCLDDRCSHRFAPLSEGRVVSDATESDSDSGKRCLQCAYHGWQFEPGGSCSRVPQASASRPSPSAASTTSVRSYPVRVASGIVWVWSDPDSSSWPLAETIGLPISPLFERYAATPNFNPFIRDLPYGMELLGENLLDLSHLPFSHHSVGNLDRDDGGTLPIRMMSSSEREERALWEEKAGKAEGRCTLPAFQGDVEDAANSDPVLVGMGKMPNVAIGNDATCTIGFYDPCHVRYHRNMGAPGTSTTVELFMCPTSAGRSRVILSNVMERFLPPLEGATSEDKEEEKKPSFRSRFGPMAIKARITKSIISKVMGGHRGHMMSHQIFDGDGIFLHKQGDRMARDGLTFRDYATPTSADVLVNAYRRWLDSAAAETLKGDGSSEDERRRMAAAAIGGDGGGRAEPPAAAFAPASRGVYLDDEPRSVMLDRYNTHTKKCKVCSTALSKMERKKGRLEVAKTAFMGSSGASGVLTAVALLLSAAGGGGTAGPILLRATALAFAGSVAATLGTSKVNRKLEDEIKEFYFVDYVHAEKN